MTRDQRVFGALTTAGGMVLANTGHIRFVLGAGLSLLTGGLLFLAFVKIAISPKR